MKKTKRKVPSLTKGATDEQVTRWTKSHDVFDRLEAGVSEIVEDHSDLDEVLREAIFQDNTAQLNMRLPPAMKAVLSKLARQRTTDATTLARIWLAERLERELRQAEPASSQPKIFSNVFGPRPVTRVIPASQQRPVNARRGANRDRGQPRLI